MGAKYARELINHFVNKIYAMCTEVHQQHIVQTDIYIVYIIREFFLNQLINLLLTFGNLGFTTECASLPKFSPYCILYGN